MIVVAMASVAMVTSTRVAMITKISPSVPMVPKVSIPKVTEFSMAVKDIYKYCMFYRLWLFMCMLL